MGYSYRTAGRRPPPAPSVDEVKEAIESIVSGGPAGCLEHRMPRGWITGEVVRETRWSRFKFFLGALFRGRLKVSVQYAPDRRAKPVRVDLSRVQGSRPRHEL